MHHGTCVTYVPWCMSGPLNRGGGGKRSRHSRRIRNSQFYVSGKRPMTAHRHDRRGIYRCVLLRFRGRIEIDHSYGLRCRGLCCHSRHSTRGAGRKRSRDGRPHSCCAGSGSTNHSSADRIVVNSYNHLFRRRSKKTSKLRVTGLCAGIHRSPMNSPHKGPVTRKMFQFDDVIMWWRHYWPLLRGIHRSQVNSPHKGQWRGSLMFSFICAWTNNWANNGEADDLRHHRAIMTSLFCSCNVEDMMASCMETSNAHYRRFVQ